MIQKSVLWYIFIIIKGINSSPIDDHATTLDSIKETISKHTKSTINQQLPHLSVHNSDQKYTSICWTESIIITEHKKTKNHTISKSYSILLDTPEKLKKLHTESENASCVEILEHNNKPKRTLNFYQKEVGDYIIKEHKTLFCGAGPVLSHHFIVWPKLNRRQIEISINPLSETKWRNCQDNQDVDDNDVNLGTDLESTLSDFSKQYSGKEDEEELVEPTLNPDAIIPNPLDEPFKEEINNHLPSLDSNEESKDGFASTGPMKTNNDSVIIEKPPEAELHEPEKINAAQLVGNPQITGKTNKHETHISKKSTNTGEHFKENSVHGKHHRSDFDNILLNREINCTYDHLGICNQLVEKSNKMLGYNNSPEAVIGKWFFLDNSFKDLDRDNSYKLNVKIIVHIENRLHQHGTELIVEENCLIF